MSKTKICLTQLSLLTNGNTAVLRHGMEQGAGHCCSPSLQELVADMFSDTEVLFLFKLSVFLEELKQL